MEQDIFCDNSNCHDNKKYFRECKDELDKIQKEFSMSDDEIFSIVNEDSNEEFARVFLTIKSKTTICLNQIRDMYFQLKDKLWIAEDNYSMISEVSCVVKLMEEIKVNQRKKSKEYSVLFNEEFFKIMSTRVLLNREVSNLDKVNKSYLIKLRRCSLHICQLCNIAIRLDIKKDELWLDSDLSYLRFLEKLLKDLEIYRPSEVNFIPHRSVILDIFRDVKYIYKQIDELSREKFYFIVKSNVVKIKDEIIKLIAWFFLMVENMFEIDKVFEGLHISFKEASSSIKVDIDELIYNFKLACRYPSSRNVKCDEFFTSEYTFCCQDDISYDKKRKDIHSLIRGYEIEIEKKRKTLENTSESIEEEIDQEIINNMVPGEIMGDDNSLSAEDENLFYCTTDVENDESTTEAVDFPENKRYKEEEEYPLGGPITPPDYSPNGYDVESDKSKNSSLSSSPIPDPAEFLEISSSSSNNGDKVDRLFVNSFYGERNNKPIDLSGNKYSRDRIF